MVTVDLFSQWNPSSEIEADYRTSLDNGDIKYILSIIRGIAAHNYLYECHDD